MNFSIITVCYNSEKTIRRTFDSILAQDFDDYEYIVVDGASTDGTVEIIKEYEPKFQGRMRWISESDQGIYDAMNKGIHMAKGEYLNMMNSDDEFESGALRAVADMEKNAPGAAVYYGITRVLAAQGTEFELIRRHHSRLPVCPLHHQSVFFASRVHKTYGMYDTNYKMAADYDFMLKLYLNGEVFCPVTSVLSIFSQAGVSGNYAKDAKKEELQVRLRYKMISSSYMFFALISHYIRQSAIQLLQKN